MIDHRAHTATQELIGLDIRFVARNIWLGSSIILHILTHPIPTWDQRFCWPKSQCQVINICQNMILNIRNVPLSHMVRLLLLRLDYFQSKSGCLALEESFFRLTGVSWVDPSPDVFIYQCLTMPQESLYGLLKQFTLFN